MDGSKCWKFLRILCALAVIQLVCFCMGVCYYHYQEIQNSGIVYIKERHYYSDESSEEASNEDYKEASEEVDCESSEEVDGKNSEEVYAEESEEDPKKPSEEILVNIKINYPHTTQTDKPICIPTAEESSTAAILDTLVVNCPSSTIEYMANSSLNRFDVNIKQFETLAAFAMNNLSDKSKQVPSSIKFWMRLNGRDVFDDEFCVNYSISGNFILPGTLAGFAVDANWSLDLEFYPDSTLSTIKEFTSRLIKLVKEEGLKIGMFVDLISCYENNLPKYPCFLLKENYETLFFYEALDIESSLMKIGRTGCFNESICEDAI